MGLIGEPDVFDPAGVALHLLAEPVTHGFPLLPVVVGQFVPRGYHVREKLQLFIHNAQRAGGRKSQLL